MYQKMKHDLGSKVSVVFNKVDEKFTPRREAAYNVEYFNKQSDSTAKMLESDRDDVHFALIALARGINVLFGTCILSNQSLHDLLQLERLTIKFMHLVIKHMFGRFGVSIGCNEMFSNADAAAVASGAFVFSIEFIKFSVALFS